MVSYLCQKFTPIGAAEKKLFKKNMPKCQECNTISCDIKTEIMLSSSYRINFKGDIKYCCMIIHYLVILEHLRGKN